MNRLPFAVSIPHGGTDIPPEFAPLVIATPEDMKEDVDQLTREIFHVDPSRIQHLLTFSTSRTFVDLNRPPESFGEAHPDGVVKRKTHLQRTVFSEFPKDTDVKAVLERLYFPYHAELERMTRDPAVKLTLDCHSMAEYGLPVSPDVQGEKRPLICLGHRGGVSAKLEMVLALQELMSDIYELPKSDIVIDKPFNGGHITRTHGGLDTPVIQIEFSRGFYLGDQVGKPEPKLAPNILKDWQGRFVRVLEGLASHKSLL